MYPLDPHGVKKWGDMTLPAPMDAPPMIAKMTARCTLYKWIESPVAEI